MTAGTLERHATEDLSWQAHWHIDKYKAADERETAFALFPKRARLAEKLGVYEKGDRGGLYVPEAKLHIAKLLKLPHITGEMIASLGADVIGTADALGNLLANAGINRVGGLAFGAGTGQIYNTANSAIGVGDTATAAAATQTDLSAAVNAANRYVQVVDSQPTFAAQVLTMLSTYATGNGNFAWAEFAIGQNVASAAAAITAAMLNRKVSALGTKTSAAAWTFTITITIS